MGTQDSAYHGRGIASRTDSERTPTDTGECTFCGAGVANTGGRSGERVEYIIPADGTFDRRMEYCSPACFIRDMESVVSIDPGT